MPIRIKSILIAIIILIIIEYFWLLILKDLNEQIIIRSRNKGIYCKLWITQFFELQAKIFNQCNSVKGYA